MWTILKWSRTVQGKISLIELNICFYGLTMDCLEQSQTVLTLPSSRDGLYMNWLCFQGIKCYAMIGERGMECSGVCVTPAVCAEYADSFGNICELLKDCSPMCQGYYLNADSDLPDQCLNSTHDAQTVSEYSFRCL